MLGRLDSITKHVYRLAINEEWALSLHCPFFFIEMWIWEYDICHASCFTRAASSLCAFGWYARSSGGGIGNEDWSMRKGYVFSRVGLI